MKKVLIVITLIFFAFTETSCRQKEQLVRNHDVGNSETESIADEIITDTDCTESEDDSMAAVYVCGAVVNPGVYYLDVSSIKRDAVDAAGGFLFGACKEYINLAEHIKDGEQIYIPFEDELSPEYNPLAVETSDNKKTDSETLYDEDGRLNINLAGRDELMKLPGIGDAKSDAIIKYRNEHGYFNDIEDIKNVDGIKDGVYNNIKDYITVG